MTPLTEDLNPNASEPDEVTQVTRVTRGTGARVLRLIAVIAMVLSLGFVLVSRGKNAAEARLAAMTAAKATLDRQLADPQTYAGNGSSVEELLRQQALAAASLADAEAEWLAAAEALEKAEG